MSKSLYGLRKQGVLRDMAVLYVLFRFDSLINLVCPFVFNSESFLTRMQWIRFRVQFLICVGVEGLV